MYFLREQKPEKVSWKISEQTRAIVQEYATYVNMEEHHVVDMFLKNLLADPNFANHLRGKRNYKRVVDKVFFGDQDMNLLDMCRQHTQFGFNLYRPILGEMPEADNEKKDTADNVDVTDFINGTDVYIEDK